jgi:signal transduction histidine kinase
LIFSLVEAMIDQLTAFGRKIYSGMIGWLVGLRMQLIMPYFSLTLIIALGGIFVVTRLVTSSVNERFANQLIEASGVAADTVAFQEITHLENLRLMAFTIGVPEAVESGDLESLRDLLFPVVVNGDIELMTVVDASGIEIISLVKNPTTNEYVESNGGSLRDYELVQNPLTGYVDEIGDKFTTLEETIYGPYLLTSAPVKLTSIETAGVIIVGTRMDSLVAEIKARALADSLILKPDGSLQAMTFAPFDNPTDDVSLEQEEIDSLDMAITKQLMLSDREYQVYYSPLILRQRSVGVLGVALPTNFVVSTEATSRNSLSLVFSCVTVAMIIIGYVLAITISRPIMRLREVSNAVASGDLDQQSGLKRQDEIGDLARSFDSMVYQLKNRTAELIQSEKLSAIGQMAAGIAHDVKNPLAVVKGMSEELKEDFRSEPQMLEYLDMISKNADRANTIISDLMKFSRESKFEKSYLNLFDTVTSALRLTEYLARKGKVQVEVVKRGEKLMLYYDPQQIEQVLINLIQNAIQAMPEGGKITLAVGEHNHSAIIQIQDTGIGIPEENIQKIFDPFFTTKPIGEGTGLGLSVSYGIIKNHDGDIRVQSKVGKGTIFTIRLPLNEGSGNGAS